jgi:hypothetical protein
MEQKSEVFYMFSVYAMNGRKGTHEIPLTTDLLHVKKFAT